MTTETVTLTVTKLTGGYRVEIPEHEEQAVATTPRQAALRAKEMIEKVLAK